MNNKKRYSPPAALSIYVIEGLNGTLAIKYSFVKYGRMSDQSQDDEREEIVRPLFWTGYTGAGRKRTIKGRETAKELKAAYTNLIHEQGELTFNQKREMFPYIFWPPVQTWCLVPFDIQASGPSKGLRAADGTVNPLAYGLGAKAGDYIWSQAVHGVFDTTRRYHQLYDDILLAIYFPWADESSPEDVPMWGLVHYTKGSDTAYVHVMTEWQESVFNKKANNERWAGVLFETLTGEQGVDESLFLGDNAVLEIQ